MRLWSVARGQPRDNNNSPHDRRGGTGPFYISGRTDQQSIWSEMDALDKRALAARAGARAPGGVAVVPRGLDEEPAGVVVSGAGDVAAVLLIARGVLAGGDAQPRRELARAGEAREVADLGDQSERRQRRDPSEPCQGLDLPGPALTGRELLELRVERSDLTLDAVEVDEHLLQRDVRKRVVEALRVDPAAMRQRPRGLAVAKHAAVPEQLLEHAVTCRGPRAAQIVAASEKVAQPLGLGGRRRHEAQQSRAVQRDELLGVTTIGLD